MLDDGAALTVRWHGRSGQMEESAERSIPWAVQKHFVSAHTLGLWNYPLAKARDEGVTKAAEMLFGKFSASAKRLVPKVGEAVEKVFSGSNSGGV
jgi:hypothetical protein